MNLPHGTHPTLVDLIFYSGNGVTCSPSEMAGSVANSSGKCI